MYCIIYSGDKMRTLYISDLDGTLLRSDQKTSAFTNRTINELADKGLIFSYATARSFSTAQKAVKGLTAHFPVIVYNGVFIRDNTSGEYLHKNLFDKKAAVQIARELTRGGVSPIVYSLIDGNEKFSYIKANISKAESEFICTRKGDLRDRPIDTFDQLIQGDIFYFTCIDEPEKLEPFFRKYRDSFNCYYQSDIYSGEWWLEIMPKAATKANAAKQLKDLLKCDRIVSFGDAVNDTALFDVSDEAYAVSNAAEILKERATGIIGSNDDDGVAKFLLERFG